MIMYIDTTRENIKPIVQKISKKFPQKEKIKYRKKRKKEEKNRNCLNYNKKENKGFFEKKKEREGERIEEGKFKLNKSYQKGQNQKELGLYIDVCV